MYRFKRYRQNIWAPSVRKPHTGYYQKKGMITQAKPTDGNKVKFSAEDVDETVNYVLRNYFPPPPADFFFDTGWHLVEDIIPCDPVTFTYTINYNNLAFLLAKMVDFPTFMNDDKYGYQIAINVIAFRENLTNENFDNCPNFLLTPSANFEYEHPYLYKTDLKAARATTHNMKECALFYNNYNGLWFNKYEVKANGDTETEQEYLTCAQGMRPPEIKFMNYYPLIYSAGPVVFPFSSNAIDVVYRQTYDSTKKSGTEFIMYGYAHIFRFE